jgi:acyl-coenzyme A synthetase/AMP-(fatty) acid ligase
MSEIPEFPERFNMASYFVDSNMEAGRGDKVAIHFDDQAITFKQAYENVNRAGNGLKALGLQPEQRVLTVLHDRPGVRLLLVRRDQGRRRGNAGQPAAARRPTSRTT